jgi:hypothetical protein
MVMKGKIMCNFILGFIIGGNIAIALYAIILTGKEVDKDDN